MIMNSDEIARNSTVFPESDMPAINNSFNENGKPIIKVIGVGGGGDNAVNHMYRQNIPGVSFVVTNTDRQALANSPVPKKIQLGSTGLGAGDMPEVAKAAAEESEEELAELFDEDTKMVFITAGMGGGTGTGAAPVVARIAREKGKLTIGIVTIPFLFEGNKKIMKALDGAEEMNKYVDAMLVINNERLTEIYKDLTLDNAFAKADDTLTIAAASISEMINTHGETNIDFKDVETTLKSGKTAIISTGYGDGENRVTKAIENALNSPLLKNRDVETSKRFLFNIYYANDAENQFTIGEMDEITRFMTNFAKDVEVIWGRTVDNSLGSKVKITILAAGFDLSLNNENSPVGTGRKSDRGKSKDTQPTNTDRIAKEYGESKIAGRDREMARARYILLGADQMDNDSLISFIEKNPTFKRGNDSTLRKEWEMLSESQKPDQKPGTMYDNGKTKTIVF